MDKSKTTPVQFLSPLRDLLECPCSSALVSLLDKIEYSFETMAAQMNQGS